MVAADPNLVLVISYAHHDSLAPPEAPVDWRFHLTQDGGGSWSEWDAPDIVTALTDIGGSVSTGVLWATRLNDAQRVRSKDLGRTWQSWLLPEGFAGVGIQALELGALWAWNGSAAIVSLDKGDTWTAATLPAGTLGVTGELRQTRPTRLLAELPNGGGVSISNDSGKTWQDLMVR